MCMWNSQVLKEFFILHIMYNKIKEEIKKITITKNFVLTDIEIIILLLSINNNDITGEEIMKICYLSTSNILYNLNNLSDNNLIKINHNNKLNHFNIKITDKFYITEEGKKMVNIIDNLLISSKETLNPMILDNLSHILKIKLK